MVSLIGKSVCSIEFAYGVALSRLASCEGSISHEHEGMRVLALAVALLVLLQHLTSYEVNPMDNVSNCLTLGGRAVFELKRCNLGAHMEQENLDLRSQTRFVPKVELEHAYLEGFTGKYLDSKYVEVTRRRRKLAPLLI